MRHFIKLLVLSIILFQRFSASAQTNLTAPVILNGATVLDDTTLAVPTPGTYVIAYSVRIRGEYVLSIDIPYASQTVHLFAEGGQFDPSDTIQILDDHSYSGAVLLNNFRFLMSPSNGYSVYLVFDVAPNQYLDSSSTIHVQYQGTADYSAAFGGTLPGDAYQVGGTGLNVVETNVGIGTQSPQNQLSLMNGLNVDQDDNNNGSYPLNNGISFGDASGEAMSSNRYGGLNQYGLDFWTDFQKRMSIGNNGWVGIGTSSPSQLLEVNGNAKLDGSISVSSIVFPDGTSQSSASINQMFTQQNGNASVNGMLQVSGNVPTPNLTSQGGYMGWNALTMGTGETDFINNQGGGHGAFAFFNTPSSGTPLSMLMYMNGNGNVGIGTSNPGATLEVNGNVKLSSGSGSSITFPDSTVQSTAWNGTTLGGDYAESVDVIGDRTTYEPGDVIVIDDAESGKFIKSSQAYSKLVAGVFSTKPGLVGRRTTFAMVNKDAEVPMAMMGIAPTKVTTENGSIETGDLLVTSSKPGYAMKATDPSRTMGAVIGKALAPLKSGSGLIEVLISLQ